MNAYARLLAAALPLAAGLTATACGHSSLIRPDDPVLADSQRRLAATAAAVEASGAPPAERVLFMQAEGFYRYRFQPPHRNLASTAAVVAAVVTELPAFQALAGSLDLDDLRVRSADGAIHLWETLLARDPHTALRPLTLYRLGWAYRNAGAAGLPRASGDEAWSELMAAAPASPLASLAAQARREPWKSKDTATRLSLLPGLGQFYLGQALSGSVRLAIGLGSLALIAVPLYAAYQRRHDLSWSHDWPLLAAGIGGVIVLSVDYTLSYQDAMRGVVESNDRVEADFDARHPEAP
ncbi:MAG TPA: hypothetical protein VIF57_10950 [Polyangia bacterium]